MSINPSGQNSLKKWFNDSRKFPFLIRQPFQFLYHQTTLPRQPLRPFGAWLKTRKNLALDFIPWIGFSWSDFSSAGGSFCFASIVSSCGSLASFSPSKKGVQSIELTVTMLVLKSARKLAPETTKSYKSRKLPFSAFSASSFAFSASFNFFSSSSLIRCWRACSWLVKLSSSQKPIFVPVLPWTRHSIPEVSFLRGASTR